MRKLAAFAAGTLLIAGCGVAGLPGGADGFGGGGNAQGTSPTEGAGAPGATATGGAGATPVFNVGGKVNGSTTSGGIAGALGTTVAQRESHRV